MSALINRLKVLAKNPLFYFCIVVLSVSFWVKIKQEGINTVIASDSRGYYAFLPTLFIYDGVDFFKTHKAEYTYNEYRKEQTHLHVTKDGKIYNKCFPGVAVMQLPFFALGTLTSYIAGDTITGYSDIYSFFYLLGSYFYFIVGIYFFVRVARWLYPTINNLKWFIPLMYLSTPVIYYSLFSMLSHHYSFALFGLFFFTLIKIQESRQLKHVFLLGLTLGLIFLIRPTNVAIILAIPFFLRDKETALGLWRWLFKDKAKPFFVALIASSVGLFLLLLTWKWESGRWLLWAYSGEGFTWTNPKIWQVLVSFRVGLFIHTPITIIAVLAAIWLWKEKSFQITFWWVYFVINTYIIASWWCWDYASPYGMRPYTEHLFILLMPIFGIILKKQFWVTTALILVACLGSLRLVQKITLQYTDQRFTADSYFKSLAFWKSYNYQRWIFSRTCEPFGELKNKLVVIDFQSEERVTSEFGLTSEIMLSPGRTESKLYCRVSVDKKMIDNDWSDVYMVYDATSLDGTKRYYLAQLFYSDKLEGRNEWAHYDSEQMIPDSFDDLEQLKVYIWNKGGKTFDIKNLKVTLEEYQKH